MIKSAHWNRAKIVATIGPASEKVRTLRKLIDAGMDVCRLNFSHGDHESHLQRIVNIRKAAKRADIDVAVLQDLPGPKIRTGMLAEESVRLVEGSDFVLTTRTVKGDSSRVGINHGRLPRDVKRGDTILLDDGRIRLRVLKTGDREVLTRVEIGGVLSPHRGVAVPGVTLSVGAPTRADIRHLRFGVEHGVDAVALSFVRSARDVRALRRAAGKLKRDVFIIAKIEKHEALENISEIVAEADGIMVARGDLGVEISVEQVPAAQALIISEANRAGKPVITATQMLESMIANPYPTRAEVTDVSLAIREGTDAVMLSAETAIGKYPVEAVEVLAKVAHATEHDLGFIADLYGRTETGDPKPPVGRISRAVSAAACRAAAELGAALIVTPTRTGATARQVSKHRPQAPVAAFSSNPTVRRRLMMSFGVIPFAVPPDLDFNEMKRFVRRFITRRKLVNPGDVVVFLSGAPESSLGQTNMLWAERM